MKTLKRFSSLLMTVVLSYGCFAQQAAEFEKDFEILAATKFDTAGVNRISQKYFSLLTPFNQVNQLGMSIKGEQWVKFPLERFRQKAIYKKEIAGLINSPAPESRLLGYLTSVAAGDTSQRKLLMRRLQSEESPACSLWLGMGLMHLGWANTSQLFKWMVKNNSEAGGLLFPMFMSLPVDSLRETAYQFSDSDDWNERICAIQTFIRTGYTVRTDSILRRAIVAWPFSAKGYAIVPAQSVRMTNLRSVLEPLLDSTATRRVALAALSDSPTDADRELVRDLSNKVVDADILDACKSSRYSEMITHWLTLLNSDKLPENYFFSVHEDTLLRSDELLPFVQEAVRTDIQPRALASLLPVLRGRTDTVSQEILMRLITNDDVSVRDNAGEALLGTCPPNLRTLLTASFISVGKYPSNVFQLAIGCGVDSLQQSAENIYNTPVHHIMQVNALAYLAEYPRKDFLELFREIISQKEQDVLLSRVAASGLGKLRDSHSIDRIIEISESERTGSDWNCIMYVKALADIGGDICKEYVSSFLKSENKYVADTASGIVQKWPAK